MKLLFGLIDGTDGMDEIRSRTGFADADFEYLKLQPYIEMATEELIKIIGDEMYTKIQEFYEAKQEEDLVKIAQSCVAFRTLSLFAPLNDLAFTNQGRQMRLDDHHKPGFEWMVDRNDMSLEKIYYRSIDRLIDNLDKTNPTIAGTKKWKDTQVYKDSFDIFFRTTAEFNEFFTIDSRFLLMKLAPAIKAATTDEILPRIGEEKLNQYMNALKAGSEVPNAKVLRQIKAACAYLALAWCIPRMSATLFPTGVLQAYVSERQTSQAKKVPAKSEVGVVTLCFEEDARKALVKLEDLVKIPGTVNSDQSITEVSLDCNKKFVST